MSLNHAKRWLRAGGLVLLMALAASAQDLRTMELFGDADISHFGRGPQPKEGYFFVFDGLLWYISSPGTGQFETEYSIGNRFDLGRMYGHHGWLLGVYDLKNFNQTARSGLGDAQVDTWSVELMHVCRTHQLHNGGFFEMFLGGRYLQFDDKIEDLGISAQNHIVGPQAGLRWFKKQGRWTFSTEGRGFAGLNVQNIRLAPEFTNIYEWTPLAEFRANATYQFTRAVSFKVGWSGIYMDGLARSAAMIDNGQISTIQNRQSTFTHGLTLGISVNR